MLLTHPFEPIWTPESKTLILGTFPSVLSRERGFYYGHPRNRFWPLMAVLCGENIPESVLEKTGLLTRHNIALWDVLLSCDITGSDDASIKQPVPNDIAALVAGSRVTSIFCNGKKAYALYQKHCKLTVPVACLPSTSPANAAWSLQKLMGAWEIIRGREKI